MLTLYHGSPRKFEVFEINPELSVQDESKLAEGYGIYLTEDKEMAKAYGQYLYVVSIEEKDVSDFTDPKKVRRVLNKVFKKLEIPISMYLNVNDISKRVVEGYLPVIKLHEELKSLLDNNERFYNQFCDQLTYEDDCLFQRLEQEYFQNLKDVVRYFDKTFQKDIFICFRNANQLKPILNPNEG